MMRTSFTLVMIANFIAAVFAFTACGGVTAEDIEVVDGAGNNGGGSASVECGTFMHQEQCDTVKCGGFIIPLQYCSVNCNDNELRPAYQSNIGFCGKCGGNIGEGSIEFSRMCSKGGAETMQVLGWEWIEGWSLDQPGCAPLVDLGYDG